MPVHNVKGRKLGRRPDHRRALLRNLAISLIQEERIATTTTRGKELRRLVERLVTYAKRDDLHGRRLVSQTLGNSPAAAAKLLGDIAPRFARRNGGYTRLLKTGFRRGDAAPTVLIEWVHESPSKRKKAAGKGTTEQAGGKSRKSTQEKLGESRESKSAAAEPAE